MERSAFVESSFAKLKAYGGSEGREGGQLFRPSSARGGIPDLFLLRMSTFFVFVVTETSEFHFLLPPIVKCLWWLPFLFGYLRSWGIISFQSVGWQVCGNSPDTGAFDIQRVSDSMARVIYMSVLCWATESDRVSWESSFRKESHDSRSKFKNKNWPVSSSLWHCRTI